MVVQQRLVVLFMVVVLKLPEMEELFTAPWHLLKLLVVVVVPRVTSESGCGSCGIGLVAVLEF